MAEYTSTAKRRIVFAPDGRVVARFVEGRADVASGDVSFLSGLKGIEPVEAEPARKPARKAASKPATEKAASKPADDEKPED